MGIGKLLAARKNPPTMIHAVRTAVAAVFSYGIARLCHLPEAYWAAISTLIVMQSTLGAALPVSAQRFAGTAFGAVVGAAVAVWFPLNVWAFGAAVLAIGFVCAILRVERSAYRYASITVAIVMLVARTASPWLIALHRFFEVSLGIAVGLVISAVWPEPATR